MASKADFTPEEWITLRAAFDATLFDTAMADSVLYDAEAKVGSRLAKYALPLVQELLTRGADKDEDEAVVAKVVTTPLATLFDEAAAILKARVTREEMADLSRTLQALAWSVAEADGAVASQEVRFLDSLEKVLRDWTG